MTGICGSPALSASESAWSQAPKLLGLFMGVVSQRQMKEVEEQAVQVYLACPQPPGEFYEQSNLVAFKRQVRAAIARSNPFNSFLLHLGKGQGPHRGCHTRWCTSASWPPCISRVTLDNLFKPFCVSLFLPIKWERRDPPHRSVTGVCSVHRTAPGTRKALEECQQLSLSLCPVLPFALCPRTDTPAARL